MFCNEICGEIERDRVRGGGGCGGVVNLELFLFVVFSRRFGGVEAVESSLGFLAFVLWNAVGNGDLLGTDHDARCPFGGTAAAVHPRMVPVGCCHGGKAKRYDTEKFCDFEWF